MHTHMYICMHVYVYECSISKMERKYWILWRAFIIKFLWVGKTIKDMVLGIAFIHGILQGSDL